MNRWSAPIGKAWSLFRHEGLFRGGARLIRASRELFRTVPAGDILFVGSGVGASALYRAHHTAEALRFHGFRTSVTTQYDPFLLRYAEKFSGFVFHRSFSTPHIEAFFAELKRRKKTVMFDTDDLVFDGEVFQKTPAYLAMTPLEQKAYISGVGRPFLEDPALSAVSTSTSFLADRLRTFEKPVLLVPNCVSEHDVAHAATISHRRNARTPQKRTLGYFSGSSGHDRDIATIAAVLERLFCQYPELTLFVAGPLTIPAALQSYADRIERAPYASREEHFENIARVDINLAPLEIGDPFCESKSEVKFLEAGLVGVPTVASATRTFCESITDGVDGWVAKTEDDWFSRVRILLEDSKRRDEMGGAAQQTVLRRSTTKTVPIEDTVHFWRDRLLNR